MAILIEEEKKSIHWFTLVVLVVILVFLAAAVYYLFFNTPPLVEVIIPRDLAETSEVADIKDFNFSGIADNSIFKSLRQHVAKPVPDNLGRANPFLPF